MAECRRCKAEIVWLSTASGERMPVDAKTVSKGDTEFEPRSGYISHVATCPDSQPWKEKGRVVSHARGHATPEKGSM
jgi:hypothetical protein